jgi:hypothetical protein
MTIFANHASAGFVYGGQRGQGRGQQHQQSLLFQDEDAWIHSLLRGVHNNIGMDNDMDNNKQHNDAQDLYRKWVFSISTLLRFIPMTGRQLLELSLVDEALLMELCPDHWTLEMKQRVLLPFHANANANATASRTTSTPTSTSTRLSSSQEEIQFWLFPPMMACYHQEGGGGGGSSSKTFHKYWNVLQLINAQGLDPIQILIVDYQVTRTLEISYNEVISPMAQLKQHFMFQHSTIQKALLTRRRSRRISTSSTSSRGEQEHVLVDHVNFAEGSFDSLIWHFKSGRFIGWILHCHEEARRMRPEDVLPPNITFMWKSLDVFLDENSTFIH